MKKNNWCSSLGLQQVLWQRAEHVFRQCKCGCTHETNQTRYLKWNKTACITQTKAIQYFYSQYFFFYPVKISRRWKLCHQWKRMRYFVIVHSSWVWQHVTEKSSQLTSHCCSFPQINHNPGQLYSKLFDEVEKIKLWKVKTDSDTVQKERRLQESKKTIETQRKAIQELQVSAIVTVFSTTEQSSGVILEHQEIVITWQHTPTPFVHFLSLQFGNESLSMKLEEQISENEELRDKYEFYLVQNHSARTRFEETC